MPKISEVNAIQVFDSRGVPTISCKITLDNGISASSMVPSGASTGSKEALELRDNEEDYNGKGVLKAVSNINNKLASLVLGKDPINQFEIDQILIDFDGTDDKSKIGANSILAISLAISKVAAKDQKIYLHEHPGKLCTDLWDDIHSISQGSEIRKYPTAKPIKLLERIIQISSNEGDYVYDPMCGSGTTAQAAKNLNRKCIINDINRDIVPIVQSRFNP